MINSLKNNFEKYLRDQYGETIEALERVFSKLGIDFFLIGALSRDLWLRHLEDLPSLRMTTDIDFAVLVNDNAQYNNIRQSLVETEGFTEDPEPYRLLSPAGIIVDLIPFGKIEKNHEVRLKGKKWIYLTVLGTKEVTELAVQMEDGFRVITLPGLCILKLNSWHDNPGQRGKDIDDFKYILYNYFTITGDEIFVNVEQDWFADPFNERITGARFLGWQMKKILEKNDLLRTNIILALETQLDNFTQDEVDKMFIYNANDPKITLYKQISELLRILSPWSGVP
jgi:predicted nucleotidyltransferase